MKKIIFSLLCLWSIPSVAADSTPLDRALADYFDNQVPQHQSAIYDLNSDGFDDALVYLRDPSLCGSAGCTLLVFRGSDQGFRFLSRTTIVLLPLAVLEAPADHPQGWQSLLVYAKGSGRVLLQGSDQGYPLNPSLQPAAKEADIHASRVLLTRD